MPKKVFGEELFVLDLANNHFGDVKHALSVVKQASRVVQDLGVNAAIKLQLRNLDTFVHPSMIHSDHRYVRRFLDTSLNMSDFKRITDAIRSQGQLVMATPFDESSIEVFEELGIEILKIASASSNDLPLLTSATETKYPILASSGGLTQFEVDSLYSRLLASGNDFAMMHCVSIYPSPSETLQLLQIKSFKERYPKVPIGWSTHENPDDIAPVQLATALGATIFERHIGIESSTYTLNNYSSTPNQLAAWIEAHLTAKAMLGSVVRLPSTKEEKDSLSTLRRGYFFVADGKPGDPVATLVEPAFPVVESNQVTTSKSLSGMTLKVAVKKGSPLLESSLQETIEVGGEENILRILYEIRATLSRSSTFLNHEAHIELSHHYGLDRYREYGAALVTVLNRDYAKKIVVMLPRQKHPTHRHMKKEETFQLLWGDLDLVINGKKFSMSPGQILTVKRGDWHKFQSNYGAVVEEISTHAFSADSEYEDEAIQQNANRKTEIKDWQKLIYAV